MFETLALALGIGIILHCVVIWGQYRDPFHPAIFMLPMVGFIYCVQPLLLYYKDPEEFFQFGGSANQVDAFQLFADTCIFLLGAGIALGGRTKIASREQFEFEKLYSISIIIGVAGFAAWAATLAFVGGFEAAYGRAYGGGFYDDGHIIELSRAGLVAVPLTILSRRAGGMRPVDWALVLFLLLPLLVQGILGARRGPTFLAIAITGASYLVIFKKKIPLWAIIGGGTAMGYLLLFLVVNRNKIYIGSDAELSFSVTDFVSANGGSEYLFSSAIYRYVFSVGNPLYGLRAVGHMLGRLVPKPLWPTVYEDITAALGGNFTYFKWAGIPVDAINKYIGWNIPEGAAPGMIGDFIVEFGAFCRNRHDHPISRLSVH